MKTKFQPGKHLNHNTLMYPDNGTCFFMKKFKRAAQKVSGVPTDMYDKHLLIKFSVQFYQE